MPFDATVLNVLIASPTDVSEERTLARSVVARWNAVHAEEKRVVLLPVGWETHAVPDMGDRPQGVINKQLLASADILVAIFWARLGTPTGEAESGTVEEIQRHVKEGKKAMLYFSSVPVTPSTAALKQIERVEAFREQCKPAGLVESFDSRPDFEKKFYDQLSRHMHTVGTGTGGGGVKIDHSAMSVGGIEISVRAASLLKTAAAANGFILAVRSVQGLVVKAGGEEFIKDRTPREEAFWEAAVEELESAGLIERKSANHLTVSARGYKAADRLT